MALNPEVQQKAQHEIREAFGDAALWDVLEQDSMMQTPPIRRTETVDKVRHASEDLQDTVQDTVDLSHVSRLPYLNAIMKEVLRFAPVGNLGQATWSSLNYLLTHVCVISSPSSSNGGRYLRGLPHPQKRDCDRERLVSGNIRNVHPSILGVTSKQ